MLKKNFIHECYRPSRLPAQKLERRENGTGVTLDSCDRMSKSNFKPPHSTIELKSSLHTSRAQPCDIQTYENHTCVTLDFCVGMLKTELWIKSLVHLP